MGKQVVLFEAASGYALFDVVESEEIGNLLEEVQQSVIDLGRFGRTVKLKAFQPFASAEEALENINAVSEHQVAPSLSSFLEMNLPKAKPGKKAKFTLGVIDSGIGSAIHDELDIPVKSDDTTREIIRGIRLHLGKFIGALDGGVMEKAQLGLGHSYSRAKVKFNVNRADNMIIQSISLLDQLDKDLNTFAMRVKEWYSWHFPELKAIVKDNYVFARCAAFIRDRTTLNEEKLEGLTEICMDEDVAKAVINASRASMGMEMSEIDLINVTSFTQRMVSLAEYRRDLHAYLCSKMSVVAPNLSELIGEMVAARLISHAGSLTNLAKCPASTVQILGAEKALFRALKTKGNTPKYGLIYHSTFIGRASAKNKGRISRYLANKCSIAARVDCFVEEPTNKYGQRLKDQVEERLKFYDTGDAPRRNVDVMAEVARELAAAQRENAEANGESEGVAKKKKEKKAKKEKKRKRSESEAGDDDAMDVDAGTAAGDDDKAAKKAKKKAKKEAAAAAEVAAAAAAAAAAAESPKKKKKKAKKDKNEKKAKKQKTG